MIKKIYVIVILNLLAIFSLSIMNISSGAKAPNAVKKTFVFQDEKAKEIAELLAIPTDSNFKDKYRLDSGIEWAVALRDTEGYPDSTPPQFNTITYTAGASPKLVISGEWLDSYTGSGGASDPRFHFSPPKIEWSSDNTSVWSKIFYHLKKDKTWKETKVKKFGDILVDKIIYSGEKPIFRIQVFRVFNTGGDKVELTETILIYAE